MPPRRRVGPAAPGRPHSLRRLHRPRRWLHLRRHLHRHEDAQALSPLAPGPARPTALRADWIPTARPTPHRPARATARQSPPTQPPDPDRPSPANPTAPRGRQSPTHRRGLTRRRSALHAPPQAGSSRLANSLRASATAIPTAHSANSRRTRPVASQAGATRLLPPNPACGSASGNDCPRGHGGRRRRLARFPPRGPSAAALLASPRRPPAAPPQTDPQSTRAESPLPSPPCRLGAPHLRLARLPQAVCW